MNASPDTAFFQMRVYKKDLAQWCYPGTTQDTATRNLRRDLTRFPALMQQLLNLGYDKYQKYFTAAQALMLMAHYCVDSEMVSATQLLMQQRAISN